VLQRSLSFARTTVASAKEAALLRKIAATANKTLTSSPKSLEPQLGPVVKSTSSTAGAGGVKYKFDTRSNQYIDLKTGRFVSPKNLPWPEQSLQPTVLEPGIVIDRFGKLKGKFAGMPGTSISERGLASGTELAQYTKLKVLKPLPAKSGNAASVSEFGATGGKIQYFFEEGIQYWIDAGYLRIVYE
jgi:hypothetical protein